MKIFYLTAFIFFISMPLVITAAYIQYQYKNAHSKASFDGILIADEGAEFVVKSGSLMRDPESSSEYTMISTSPEFTLLASVASVLLVLNNAVLLVCYVDQRNRIQALSQTGPN